MHNSHNKKILQMFLFVLIAFIALGIGYAFISSINLIISGNATASSDQLNFKVKFLNIDGVTPTIESPTINTVSVDSDTTASFNIASLDGKGQSVIATYRVKNESAGIGVDIGLNLTNTNTEYFKVTEHILDDKLQVGEETTVTITVEMLKTPIESAVSTTVTATLTATPLDNIAATGGEPKEKIKPAPLVYTVNGVSNIYINTDISNWTRVYSNFAAAKAEFGYPAAIAHETDDGLVKVSYVAFEKNNRVYYLKGRINELEAIEKPVYDWNVRMLKGAFGSDWESACYYNNNGFFCSIDGLKAYAISNGDVYVNGSNWYCSVNHEELAHCNILNS